MNMVSILSSLLDSLTAMTLAGWLVKITLLSTLACAFLLAARRMQPAVRHAVAVGALFALVIVPGAARVLPDIPLRVLHAPAIETVAPVPPVAPIAPVIRTPSRIFFETSPVRPIAPRAIRVTPLVPRHLTPLPPVAPVPPEKSVHARKRALLSGSVSYFKDQFRSPDNWRRLGVVLWVMIGVGLLLRLSVSFARAHRIAKRALYIDDDDLRVEVERACRVLGVNRVPAVALSNDVAVPLVLGVVRPRIVLPAQAVRWTHDRVRVVLLHEVAHIRRNDAAWTLFARIVGASLWFHPLVAMLSRQVRCESERACDDLVLASGVRGSDYAEHLVSIARMSCRRESYAGAALAFAARSTLEQRVASVLSARPRRVSPKLIGTLVAASVAVFATIAALHPVAKARALSADEVISPVADLNATVSAVNVDVAALKSDVQVARRDFARQKYELGKFQYQLAGNSNDDEDDEDGEMWFERGYSYYHRDRFDKAGRAYENAARFGYRRDVAYYNAGCSYALAKMPDEAFKMLEAALDEGFDDLDMYASDEDLNSLRSDPRFKKLMDDAMNSDEGQQRLRRATRQYERLGARGKDDVDEGDWNEVGIDLMRAGDYDRAATAFDNEFKLSGNEDEDALYNKACAMALAGKNAEALKLLEQAIATGNVPADHMEEDPDLISLHKEKRFGELVDLAEDLELYADGDWHGSAWSMNGRQVWKIRNMDDEAYWKKRIPHFEDVVRENPKMGRAYFNLGYAQLKSGDAKACTPSFQKALDLGFKRSTMMYNLACSTAQEGKIDAAFDWLDKAGKAGFDNWMNARYDEDLDPLHSDKRWKEIKQKAKDQQDEARHGRHRFFWSYD